MLRALRPRGPAARTVRDADKFVEACSSGDVREVAWRVLQGQDVDARHSYLDLSGLQIAARQGQDTVLELLLQEGAGLESVHAATGNTALHFAAGAGRVGAVKILLAKGADKHVRNCMDSTRFGGGGGRGAVRRLTPLQLCEEYQKDDVRALLRDPPFEMPTPFLTRFDKASFAVLWQAPVSKGAEIDGYRLIFKTLPGGFADPTPVDFNHRHSLPDEAAGWGDVVMLPPGLDEVPEQVEQDLVFGLAKKRAAEMITAAEDEAREKRRLEEEAKARAKAERREQRRTRRRAERGERRNNNNQDEGVNAAAAAAAAAFPTTSSSSSSSSSSGEEEEEYVSDTELERQREQAEEGRRRAIEAKATAIAAIMQREQAAKLKSATPSSSSGGGSTGTGAATASDDPDNAYGLAKSSLDDPTAPRLLLRGTYAQSGLAPATDYVFAMRAHNPAGWGPLSATVAVRTKPDVPGIPTGLIPTGNTATAVSMIFGAPIDYGEPIDWYEIAFRYHTPPEDDEIAWAVLKESQVGTFSSSSFVVRVCVCVCVCACWLGLFFGFVFFLFSPLGVSFFKPFLASPLLCGTTHNTPSPP
jgi:hypothetical protein